MDPSDKTATAKATFSSFARDHVDLGLEDARGGRMGLRVTLMRVRYDPVPEGEIGQDVPETWIGQSLFAGRVDLTRDGAEYGPMRPVMGPFEVARDRDDAMRKAIRDARQRCLRTYG